MIIQGSPRLRAEWSRNILALERHPAGTLTSYRLGQTLLASTAGWRYACGSGSGLLLRSGTPIHNWLRACSVLMTIRQRQQPQISVRGEVAMEADGVLKGTRVERAAASFLACDQRDRVPSGSPWRGPKSGMMQ